MTLRHFIIAIALLSVDPLTTLAADHTPPHTWDAVAEHMEQVWNRSK